MTRALISEVNAYPSDKSINWTELSRKYKLRKVADGREFGNAGQVLKASLSSKVVKEWIRIDFILAQHQELDGNASRVQVEKFHSQQQLR